MARYLISTTEIYRVDTEEEAVKLIDEAKADNTYTLTKYGKVHKEKKQKGEIVDSYEKVTLTKTMNDEKDPYSDVKIYYEV